VSPWSPAHDLLSGTSEQAFSPFLDSGNTIHLPHTYVLGLDYMQTSCQVLGWKGGHSEHKPSLTGFLGIQVARARGGHSPPGAALTAHCFASWVAWAPCSSETSGPLPLEVSLGPSLPGRAPDPLGL